MKKLFVLFFVFVFGITIATAGDSQFYAKDVFIAKITACDKGYRVIYKTNLSNLVTVYVPIEWFYKEKKDGATQDGFAKAELVYRSGPQYPYMQIFWKNGKFHHLRIFANSDYNDSSWGAPQDIMEQAKTKFDPAIEPNLTF